ncbi:MAG TPA: hypothetical protein VM243_09380 [Phycisphaerae bacterium]|nr:hypothetical protein [Phycisphaerae bacterium]
MTGRFDTTRWTRVSLALLGAAALGQTIGCREDARLSGKAVPHVEVRTVEDQGVTLDPEASPKEVAYVLLRAIGDDIWAGSDLAARQRAVERQLAVCDPDYMYERYLEFFGDRAVSERDEWVSMTVNKWAPTLAYYAEGFDFDLPTAQSLMQEGSGGRSENWPDQTVYVDLPVAAPEGISGADVVVRVRLHRHGGEQGHWRVFSVGFAGRPRADATVRAGGGKPSPAE